MQDFRFVVVGSGNMAGTYASVLGELPDMEMVATVSRSGRRPADVPESVPCVPSLADVPVPFDGVVAATPNGLHHTIALEAAKLGKHVLTEKVLDVTTEAMDTMIAACRAANVKLGVAFQRRMSPDNQVMKRLLGDGALGRVFGADLVVKFFRDQAYYDSAAYRGDRTLDGGGPFMQQAAHNVDVYVWLFGLPEKVASAMGTFCHDMEGEDHGAALLSYANGMVGTIIASTSCKPGFPARLEVHAEKGTVVLENDVITVCEVEGMENPSATGDTVIHDGAASASVSDTAGHEAILTDFVQAVREGRDPIVPGEDARRATDLILQIYGNTI
jgi:predicted dehydrogenase